MASHRHKSRKITDRIPVIFRVFKDEGDVIAMFPTLPGAALHTYTCLCYQRLGQHGAANIHGVMQKSRAATPSQYASLKRELEKIGYKLRVVPRSSPSMEKARRDAYREYGAR